jgi:hypothetical protein
MRHDTSLIVSASNLRVALRTGVARRGNRHRPRCIHCDLLAGPAVGHVADRLRRHTLTRSGCAFAAAVAGLGYVMFQGFSGLLVVALVQAAMLAPIVPLSDALATTAARTSEFGEGRRFECGRAVRVWLRSIHSRYDAERLNGQWYWSGEHSLVQRNAAWYWRRCRSVASQDSGSTHPD